MAEDEKLIQAVIEEVSSLSPGSDDAPTPASHALANLYRRAENSRPKWSMQNAWRFPKRRMALAGAFAVLLFIFALTIQGVRVAASDFLGLFRVQKFAALSVSPEQLALLEEIASSGLYPGEIEMTNPPGEPIQAQSLAEAEELYGGRARLPTDLGSPVSIHLIDGGNGRLIVNVESARTILAAVGVEGALIPDSLDGQPVAVTVHNGLAMNWADGVSLMQAPSPLVDYPADVDVAAIGEAVLQALGMSPSEAAKLARSIDWTNTLLLPVPANVAQFEEVRVDGVTGLALSGVDGRNAALLWERDGIVYGLTGNNVEQLVQLGNDME